MTEVTRNILQTEGGRRYFFGDETKLTSAIAFRITAAAEHNCLQSVAGLEGALPPYGGNSFAFRPEGTRFREPSCALKTLPPSS